MAEEGGEGEGGEGGEERRLIDLRLASPQVKSRENFSKILGILSCLASQDKFKFGAFLAISGARVPRGPTGSNIDTFDPGLPFLV